MLRIAICDDEENVCTVLEKYIIQSCNHMQIYVEIDLFFSGSMLKRHLIEGNMYNIFFLDIELKDDNGTADIKDDSDHAVVMFDYSYNESTQVYLYDLYDPSGDGCIMNNRNIINLAPGESVVAYGYES